MKKVTRVSHFQWEIILDEMVKNPIVFTGYKSTARGREANIKMWRRLSLTLNSHGSGAKKSPQEWATWFNNIKSKLKKKVGYISSDERGTGVGAPITEDMTELETRLLQLLGPGFGQGLLGDGAKPYDQNSISTASAPTPCIQEPEVEIIVENLPTLPPNQQFEDSSSPCSAEEQREASPCSPIVQPAPSPSSNRTIPLRRTRRHYRTQPMAHIDKPNRIMYTLEKQKIDAKREVAQALTLIGTNMGMMAEAQMRMATALEQMLHYNKKPAVSPDY